MHTEEYFLNACRILAEKASAKGNPAVGAVIVCEGHMIAEGEEASKSKNDITCHAELEALRYAVKSLDTVDLSACTLYSSHEPCIMCAYAIRFYRISRVVFRQQVSYLGSVSSSMPLLTSVDVPPHWNTPPDVAQWKYDE